MITIQLYICNYHRNDCAPIRSQVIEYLVIHVDPYHIDSFKNSCNDDNFELKAPTLLLTFKTSIIEFKLLLILIIEQNQFYNDKAKWHCKNR